MAENFVNFLEYHKPPLQSGEYTVTLGNQLLKIGGSTVARFPAVRQKLFVEGARHSLSPSDIFSVFPPAGSRGDYSHAFPHVILNRSTFPWERSIDGMARLVRPFYPWLAILLFDEAEAPLPKTITLQELWDSKEDLHLPNLADFSDDHVIEDYLQVGEQATDQVTVIDVDPAILNTIMPKRSDLEFTAHSRRETDGRDASKVLGEERAIIVGNRLPKVGGRSVAHLVALENCFANDGEFLFADDSGQVRLISLKNWAFSCEVVHLNFARLLAAPPDSFRISDLTLAQLHKSDESNEPKVWETRMAGLESLKDEDFDDEDSFLAAVNGALGETLADDLKNELLDAAREKEKMDASMLNLPYEGLDGKLQPYLKAGYVPMPHHMRIAEDTVSWYRGPLIPGNAVNSPEQDILPVETADRLLVYDDKSGLLDVSYAAAWTLGRQMALKDRKLALQLYKLKRLDSIENKRQAAASDIAYLPVGKAGKEAIDKTALETEIQQWLTKRRWLHDIPFQYLVPDERLLPGKDIFVRLDPFSAVESSLRLFKIDPFWIKCLQDGVLSIGDMPTEEGQPKERPVSYVTMDTISGFLLRSEVVAGFPAMEILAYETTPSEQGKAATEELDNPIAPERTERLADNILLCLFPEGKEIRTVDFFLPAQAIHFGLEREAGGGYEKDLKALSGIELSDSLDIGDSHYHDPDARVFNFAQLAADLKTDLENDPNITPEGLAELATFTAADFALQMMEGAPKARFFVNG